MMLLDAVIELLVGVLIFVMMSWVLFRLIAPDMLNTVGAMDWASGIVLLVTVLALIRNLSKRRARQK